MKFEPGKTYSTRSVCDHNCIISVTVAKRTAKTITTAAGKTLRISVSHGDEWVRPWGRYSMAPTIGADDRDLSAVIHPAYAGAAERDNAAYDTVLQMVATAVAEPAANVVRLADYRKSA